MMDEGQVQRLYGDIDADGDGRISKAEFLAAVSSPVSWYPLTRGFCLHYAVS